MNRQFLGCIALSAIVHLLLFAWGGQFTQRMEAKPRMSVQSGVTSIAIQMAPKQTEPKKSKPQKTSKDGIKQPENETQEHTRKQPEEQKQEVREKTDKRQEKLIEQAKSRGAKWKSNVESVHNPAPRYPQRARIQDQEGTVKLMVDINSNGYVIKVKIHKSSGFNLLDREAKSTIRRWQFDPSSVRQSEVVSTIVPVTFELD